MMTLSIGRCCLLAYWPIPSASATATRNRWLPLRNATLIADPPVTRLEHSRSSALSVPASAADEPQEQLPAEPRISIITRS